MTTEPQPREPARPVQLLTVAEVAQLLRCSPRHVYDLIARGEFREVTDIGNGRARTRIPEAAFNDYVAAHTRSIKRTSR